MAYQGLERGEHLCTDGSPPSSSSTTFPHFYNTSVMHALDSQFDHNNSNSQRCTSECETPRKTQKHLQTVTGAGDTLASRVSVREVKVRGLPGQLRQGTAQRVALEDGLRNCAGVAPRRPLESRPRFAQGVAVSEIPRITCYFGRRCVLFQLGGTTQRTIFGTTLGSTPARVSGAFPQAAPPGTTPGSTLAQFFQAVPPARFCFADFHSLMNPHFRPFRRKEKGEIFEASAPCFDIAKHDPFWTFREGRSRCQS